MLLTDDDIREFLGAAHRALDSGGRFAFETRSPLHRAWETWTPDDLVEIEDDEGRTVRVWHDVEALDGEYVTFTETYASDAWPAPTVMRDTLRFIAAAPLDHLLAEAGFVVDERYGDWDRSLMTPASPEIITVARRTTSPSA